MNILSIKKKDLKGYILCSGNILRNICWEQCHMLVVFVLIVWIWIGCNLSAFFPLMCQLFLHLCTGKLKVTICYWLKMIWQPLPVFFLPPNTQAPSLISHKGDDSDWTTMVWQKMWYIKLWQATIPKEYTWHQIFHTVLAVLIPRWLVTYCFCLGFEFTLKKENCVISSLE